MSNEQQTKEPADVDKAAIAKAEAKRERRRQRNLKTSRG